MKLNKLILFVCLIALTTKSIARKKGKRLPFANPVEAVKYANKKHEGETYNLSFYRNNFYNICLKLTDDYHYISSNNDCLVSFMQTNIKHNCNEKDFENLKTEKFFDGPTNMILYSRDLPFDTILEAMQMSYCVNPISTLDKKYAVPTLTRSEMRVRFMNSHLPSYADLPKQFYEMGEYVASVNPIGKGLDLSFFVEQLNLSEKLRKTSILAAAASPEEAPSSVIELESNGDLKIEKAALYLDKIVPNVYHETLYLCVRNTQKNKAYHFVVDRAARDPTHEKDTWTAVLKMLDMSAMATLVRVNFYSHSETCDESETPDSQKFNPKFNLVHVGKDQSKNLAEMNDFLSKSNRTEKFKSANPMTETVLTERNSFKIFIVAIQRYALRYPGYNIYDNCQHFATGFFNYLTNQNDDYVNIAKMKELGTEKFNSFRTSKDPFNHFFTEEDDVTFVQENSKRVAANNRRRFKKRRLY